MCIRDSALVKQYQKLFSIDKVDLHFSDGALEAISEQALERNMGARGLRTIIENAMMDTMYTIPSEQDVAKVEITRDVITKHASPRITRKEVNKDVEMDDTNEDNK